MFMNSDFPTVSVYVAVFRVFFSGSKGAFHSTWCGQIGRNTQCFPKPPMTFDRGKLRFHKLDRIIFPWNADQKCGTWIPWYDTKPPPASKFGGFFPPKSPEKWLYTLSPKIMEVENSPKWKETNIYWRDTHFPLNHDYGRFRVAWHQQKLRFLLLDDAVSELLKTLDPALPCALGFVKTTGVVVKARSVMVFDYLIGFESREMRVYDLNNK